MTCRKLVVIVTATAKELRDIKAAKYRTGTKYNYWNDKHLCTQQHRNYWQENYFNLFDRISSLNLL